MLQAKKPPIQRVESKFHELKNIYRVGANQNLQTRIRWNTPYLEGVKEKFQELKSNISKGSNQIPQAKKASIYNEGTPHFKYKICQHEINRNELDHSPKSAWSFLRDFPLFLRKVFNPPYHILNTSYAGIK